MIFKADLHCHSTCSDGTLSPMELIDLAKNCDLQGLSITDHDSIAAYPAALIYGKEKGIQLIPGIEFSADLNGTSVHILGYSFDPSNPSLLDFCHQHQKRRLARALKILDKLKKEGLLIEPEELLQSKHLTIGRPHIAKLLIEKGYVKDMSQAFYLYLGDGKKCYESGGTLSVEETLDILHQAQGLAILAHPHLYKHSAFVRKILSFQFDGIECEYARMQPHQNIPWIELASSQKLLITGGSDFHGSTKPLASLGSSTTPWERFEPLLIHFRKHSPDLL